MSGVRLRANVNVLFTTIAWLACNWEGLRVKSVFGPPGQPRAPDHGLGAVSSGCAVCLPCSLLAPGEYPPVYGFRRLAATRKGLRDFRFVLL